MEMKEKLIQINLFKKKLHTHMHTRVQAGKHRRVKQIVQSRRHKILNNLSLKKVILKI